MGFCELKIFHDPQDYESPSHFQYIISKLHGHQSKTTSYKYKCAVSYIKRTRQENFEKRPPQMKQAEPVFQVCQLFNWQWQIQLILCAPTPPLNHLFVIMDLTTFRLTNQSLSNSSLNYDLCLPCPSFLQQRPPSTLTASVGNTVAHTNIPNTPNTHC